MNFTKRSMKSKYLVSIIGEEFGMKVNLTENKEVIINALEIIQEIEDYTLLNNFLLSHIKTCSRESRFEIFSIN